MSCLLYIALYDQIRERALPGDCDAVEQAGIIDRTLMPVLHSGQGWANSRKSRYTARCEIRANAASCELLHREGW